MTELADQRISDILGDLGQAGVLGGVPGADQAAQRTLRLEGPMLVGVDLGRVGEVA